MFHGIVDAYNRLKGVANRTPILTSRTLNDITGCQVFLKCENYQRTGSFKFRGAYNAVSNLTEEQRKKGIITYSSGNHGQAIAKVGQIFDVKTVIVMPSDVSKAKLDASKGYGAEVVLFNKEETTREEIAAGLIEKHGFSLIPPFNSIDVLSGQGTAALELIQEIDDLDYLFVPCGGGGLLSGCSIASKTLNPSCKVIGVEPITADDATKSFKTGVIHTIKNPSTVADGVRTTSLGEITFEIIKKYVDDMITVSDREIINTMKFIWSRMKTVVEPTGALSLTPLYSGSYPLKNKKVGIIVSGGNIDLANACNLFNLEI